MPTCLSTEKHAIVDSLSASAFALSFSFYSRGELYAQATGPMTGIAALRDGNRMAVLSTGRGPGPAKECNSYG